MLESLFNKSRGLKPCNFIKKRLQHRCFPVNLTKFLRSAFFIEHLLFYEYLAFYFNANRIKSYVSLTLRQWFVTTKFCLISLKKFFRKKVFGKSGELNPLFLIIIIMQINIYGLLTISCNFRSRDQPSFKIL